MTEISPSKVCAICGVHETQGVLTPFAAIHAKVAADIRRKYNEIGAGDYICARDLNTFRTRHIENLLEDEKGELTNLEKEVLSALSAHELISEHPDFGGRGELTLGEKLSDNLAAFGGSWKFIILFGSILAAWIVLNSVILITGAFDPYPFIFLNLILSCIAAVQAPVIMMSQNRQEAKDRLRSEYDYKINLT